jgi:F5/8 type C domain
VSRPFALLVAIGLLVGASTGVAAGARDAEVRPFSEVQVGDIRFSRDPSDPSRGIFRVQTAEPMICAIVWGRTRNFGRFNNSLAMNGTGIEDHQVLLPDARAGVEYRYVIEGITADGTLYRSKVGRFELPAGQRVETPALVQGLRNVATDARVTDVSSEFSAGFAAANAIDDDTATEWATKGDGDTASITLDLGAPTAIAAVEFLTRSMADGSATTRRYTVSVDGGAPLGPYRAGTVAKPRPSPVDVTGQLVRFDVAGSTGGNVGAVEIRVYAAG